MLSTHLSLEHNLRNFLEDITEVCPQCRRDLLEKAFRFSWQAHADQKRKSGEPFLTHPLAVAFILAEQNIDTRTIAAGLLHDVLEDTTVPRNLLVQEFGEEVVRLVDGVTKIDKIEMRSLEQRQAETYRKLLLSMAKDVRVIIIKFADRLHNLRTLKCLEKNKIRHIAQETLDIYAPLAHRLGMARMKWELEDLAFKHLHPEQYKKIVSKVVASRHEREKIIDRFTKPLRARLEEEGISATIVGRPKHFYSIYRKMKLTQSSFNEIFDLLAIRIISRTPSECYLILGLVHSLWRPIQGRFKDYISTQKSNGYQSLHTTVVGQYGNIVEIQIRTWGMHHVAEDGIAAHWLYKDNNDGTLDPDDSSLSWLKNLIEWQKDLTDSAEFFELFKIDLYHAEIFVFTPKGDLISLPKGATVLDFAFAVHTDLGLHCVGAKVDGKFSSVDAVLKSGQTVEVLHSSSKNPSPDWLQDVRTPKARSAVRRWLKNTGRNESIILGKKIVRTHFNKLHLSSPFSDHIPDLLQYLGINSLDRLYELIGTGEMPISRAMQYFKVAKVRSSVSSRMVSHLVDTFVRRSPGIVVGNSENVMVRFAKCCNPIPGDAISGFVTRGRGIAIHRSDCEIIKSLSENRDRIISIAWDKNISTGHIVFLQIEAKDRPGLLHDISSVLVNFGVNILEASVTTKHDRCSNIVKIEVRNRNQLKEIANRLQKIKGVESIKRTRDYIYSAETSTHSDEQAST